MRLRRAWVWGGFLVAGLALAAAVRGAGVRIESIDGVTLKPFEPAGRASVVFFVARDCPVSNCLRAGDSARVPGVRRAGRRVLSDVRGRRGARDRGSTARFARICASTDIADIPAAIDRSRAIATHAKATITPQAVVVDRSGAIRYRGRIDNFYAALGRGPAAGDGTRPARWRSTPSSPDAPVPKPETEAVGCYIVDPAVLRK